MGIPQNEPKNAIVAEHAPHLAKDFNQGGDVSLRRRLEADLATAALIITQLKIRRAGHRALNSFIMQWNSSRIATDDHRVSSCRPRPGAKGAGRFFPPLAGGARLRKNIGVRFRDGPGRFFPGTARNVRRNLFGFEGRNADSWMWRRARWKKKEPWEVWGLRDKT